jgi:N-acetylated-alpha-linked acidic dipeptidase
MRTFAILASALITIIAPIYAATNLIGFSVENSAKQLALEKRFDRDLSAREQREWLEQMSAAPNHVGAPHNKENAEFILAKFREWGWEAEIETFEILYPTPLQIRLEMTEPNQFKAALHEPPLSGDRTSTNTGNALPPYVAFCADGDVTAELVYVNTGMPDDYKELQRRGISVKGKIVIARYGGGWRGLKPKLAAEHGAIGCLIYSDPRDDGFGEGDVYPTGGHRPPQGVQRGSVLDLPVAPGDPLTPDSGATANATRVSLEEAKTLTKIPTLPISYGDAEPLLAALRGPVVPGGWRGGLPITYHFGPGLARVRLTIKSDWSRKTIYNVIAKIHGSDSPEQWIMRGNHHDGWVFGAWDPLSAHCALMSEAKAIGQLVKDGWKPRRTIVYTSWDAEEPGLIGSTEWVESHADELKEKAVLYVNSDTNGRGFLRMGGSHSFQKLVHESASAVQDPKTGVDALTRLRARMLAGNWRKAGEEEKWVMQKVTAGEAPPLDALGSGSDFSPFLQHLGIASLDIRYGGEDESGGIYHSIYDSFDHYVRFGDPDFSYGVALAQTVGRVILRAANAELLPLRFSDLVAAVENYLHEVRTLLDNTRQNTEQQHRLIENNFFKLAADPKETDLPPDPEPDVPYLNFAPMENALARFKEAAQKFDQAAAKFENSKRIADANVLLQKMEQTLTTRQGLPGRPWFRHMIYAPGLYTGYGVKTLPGIREAIEQRRWSEAEEFIKIIAATLNAESEQLSKSRAILSEEP